MISFDNFTNEQLLEIKKDLLRVLKKRKKEENINTVNKKKIPLIENNNEVFKKDDHSTNIIINEETKLMELIKFKNLKKDNQDIYLSSLILSQTKNNNNIIKTKWLISRDSIIKNLKVSPVRLKHISDNIFLNKNIKKRIHGNINKDSNNKLNKDDICDIRTFVLNLEFEWWPEELQGKEYCKVLSNELTWKDLYNKYVIYKCKKDNITVDKIIVMDTFKKYFKEKCPDVILKSSKFDVCNKCICYKNLIRNIKNIQQLDNHKRELFEHLRDAQFRRQQYSFDCKNKNVICISFDFKQAIQIPTLVHQANMLYFSRKFNIHCFNIVNETKEEHNIHLYGENKSNKKYGYNE